MVVLQNVGIDIYMADFRVCFMVLLSDQSRKIKGTRKFKNTRKGIKEFRQWVEKKRLSEAPLRMTMEATGIYYEALAYTLYNHNYDLSVVLPNKSKYYFQSLNMKSKTDKIDAEGLARFGLERKLETWKPVSKQMYTLKKKNRERIRLMEEKNVISNQLHAERHTSSPDKTAIKRMTDRIDFIDKQIKVVEKEIRQEVEKDPELLKRIENITKQLKGMALVTVACVIAETDGFVLFNNQRQVVSFAGYDVVQNESGTKKGKTRISKKGNSYIRRALFFPALTVVKYHKEFRQIYERVFDRTKIKMKGYVAVQRKLLVLIYTLFKKNEAYDPNYYKKNVPKVCRQDADPAYTG